MSRCEKVFFMERRQSAVTTSMYFSLLSLLHRLPLFLRRARLLAAEVAFPADGQERIIAPITVRVIVQAVILVDEVHHALDAQDQIRFFVAALLLVFFAQARIHDFQPTTSIGGVPWPVANPHHEASHRIVPGEAADIEGFALENPGGIEDCEVFWKPGVRLIQLVVVIK
jgi:hypothetical protein